MKLHRLGFVAQIITRALLYAVSSLLILLFTIYILLGYTNLGTYSASKLTDWLVTRYGVNITIDRLCVSFPLSVELQNTLVYDLRGDTLLWASRASTSLIGFSRMGRKLGFGRTELHGALLNLQTDSTGILNINEFFNVFKTTKKPKAKAPFMLTMSKIVFSDVHFVFHRHGAQPVQGRMCYQYLDFQHIGGIINHMQVVGDSVRMFIADLHFLERSGFAATHFETKMSLSRSAMHFQDIRLQEKNQELHVAAFQMFYDGWESMKDFIQNVDLRMELRPSVLTPRFFSYFFQFPVSDYPIYASGRASGRVNSLTIQDLALKVGEVTRLAVRVHLEGLPKVHEAIINARVEEFTTTLFDVREVMNELRLANFRLPPVMQRLHNLTYKGELVGFLDDFVAYGSLTSDIGNLGVDVSLRLDGESTYFEGDVSTRRLQVGRLLGVRELGRTDLTSSVRGKYSKSAGIQSDVQVEVDNLEYHGYKFRKISADGSITPKSFSGRLAVRDTAFKFDFQGKVDFSVPVPQFQFGATAHHIDLQKIHWYDRDSLADLRFEMNAFFEGKTLDDLLGNIAFAELRYKNERGEARLDGLRLSAFNDRGGKSVTLESSALYASIWTDRRYDRFFPSVRQMLVDRLPALYMSDTIDAAELGTIASEESEYVYYRASLITRTTDSLFAVFRPEIRLAPRTEIKFEYNATTRHLGLQLACPWFVYGTMGGAGVDLRLKNGDSIAELGLQFGSANFSTLLLDSFHFHTSLTQDFLRSSLYTRTPNLGKGYLNLNTETHLYPAQDSVAPYAVVSLMPSNLQLQGNNWYFSRARITMDTTSIEVLNCNAQSEHRRFSLAGRLSRHTPDTLSLALDNVDLGIFDQLVHEYKLAGVINGEVSLVSPLSSLNLLGQLSLSNFEVNDYHIGNLDVLGRWAGVGQPFRLRLENTQADGHKAVAMHLNLAQNSVFAGELRMNKCQLRLLNLFTPKILHSEGVVNADLQLSGSFQKPLLSGSVQFGEARFDLLRFNTQLLTSDKVVLRDNKILFNDFKAKDLGGHPLFVDGDIGLQDLQRPEFNLTVRTQQFRALQTQPSDELFHGQLWVSSSTKVQGSLQNLRLRTTLRTEAGTQLSFQLPTYAEVKENKMLEFVQKTTEGRSKDVSEVKKSETALSYAIDLNVTNDALTQLLVNPRTGDMLRCRGTGVLNIEGSPTSSGVRIFGDYTISRGEYTFILQGLLSKKFKIQAGSKISFSGAPENAIAQIEASYRAKAALERLVPGVSTEKYKRRIPVDCKIIIEGSLQAPRIQFKIDVPQADPETQGLLAAALNTDEKVMRQFASLLVMGNFLSETRTEQVVTNSTNSRQTTNTTTSGDTRRSSNDGGGEVLLSSFMELIFNNLNSWIAQIENAPSIDFGFNYRPGDAYTKDEAELSVSTQWFDGRLNVDVNWDVNRNNTSSVVAGDINVTQQSSLLENLQYKAFARSNDDLVFNDLSPYTAGAGIVLSDSFDNLRELLQRLKQLFSRKKSKEELTPVVETE